ncbi:DUF1850 domain-containing protein [Desulfonema ishimotonii]|uniref:DUF1850 domain-containing protein n=1 Tax=Desulfonema ishimotonii TaxID=45657 RepID=A0A401FZJ4_9BACT|nr:DUF1850 domain-containing protein [Desulfonema ishimotonii]GBC62412.1 DUF1850 domain-containing protein [Desulfonema ishimotonii]
MKICIHIIVIACILRAGVAAGEIPRSPRLVVRDYETGKALLNLPVRYEQQFTIRYIHSVDISPVFEVFRIDEKKGFVLEETYFRMFGAGMGHWEGHGRLTYDGQWTRIRDMNYPVGSFILRVGSKGVDHTLILGNRSVNLSEMAEGRRVEVLCAGQQGAASDRHLSGDNSCGKADEPGNYHITHRYVR